MIHERKSMMKAVRRYWPPVLVLGGLLLAIGSIAGCSSTAGIPTAGAMNAEVSVVADPEGGTDVSSLSCTFEVTEIPESGTAPIAVRASWAASCGVHKTEAFTFTGGTKTFLTTYEELGGYALNKTFWVEIRWQDARGSHLVKSASAPCSAL